MSGGSEEIYDDGGTLTVTGICANGTPYPVWNRAVDYEDTYIVKPWHGDVDNDYNSYVNHVAHIAQAHHCHTTIRMPRHHPVFRGNLGQPTRRRQRRLAHPHPPQPGKEQ